MHMLTEMAIATTVMFYMLLEYSVLAVLGLSILTFKGNDLKCIESLLTR